MSSKNDFIYLILNIMTDSTPNDVQRQTSEYLLSCKDFVDSYNQYLGMYEMSIFKFGHTKSKKSKITFETCNKAIVNKLLQ
jgi:hypothetical protein